MRTAEEAAKNVLSQILDALRCWGAHWTRGRLIVDPDNDPAIDIDGVVHKLSRRDLTGAKQLFELGCAEHIPRQS